MTPPRPLHRAAGYPPVRPGDVVQFNWGAVAQHDWAVYEGGRWLAESRHLVWAGQETAWVSLYPSYDRIIPAPRPHPTGGWGHRVRP